MRTWLAAATVTIVACTATPPGGGGSCTLPAWSATTVYVGGNQVSYNGHKYTAKWWTLGETPGRADVWQDNGPC